MGPLFLESWAARKEIWLSWCHHAREAIGRHPVKQCQLNPTFSHPKQPRHQTGEWRSHLGSRSSSVISQDHNKEELAVGEHIDCSAMNGMDESKWEVFVVYCVELKILLNMKSGNISWGSVGANSDLLAMAAWSTVSVRTMVVSKLSGKNAIISECGQLWVWR